MTNFTELFVETLNATLSKMVAEAVAQQSEVIAKMQETIWRLEATVAGLEDSIPNEEDITRIVDNAVDNVDLEEKLINSIELTELFDEPAFGRAVREVISEAMG